MTFEPNRSTIAKCIAEIKSIQRKNNIDTRKIITSRDKNIRNLLQTELVVRNVPDGFSKVRLPVFFERETTLYISTGAAHAHVPEHSHDEGDGIRFMISGSIHYGEMELTEGDWMFVPAGTSYSFDVGPRGATMCYCYSCCCA